MDRVRALTGNNTNQALESDQLMLGTKYKGKAMFKHDAL